MVQAIYSGHLRLRGPWIVDAAALTQLEAKLAEVEAIFKEYEREKVEANKGKERDFLSSSTFEKELALSVSKGRVIPFKGFDELRNSAALESDVPSRLDIEYKCGYHLKFSLDIDSDLVLDVTPMESPQAQMSFSIVQKWVDEHRPSRFERAWAFIGGGIFIFAGIALELMAMSLSLRETIHLKEASKELLARGIHNEADQMLATQMILQQLIEPKLYSVAPWLNAVCLIILGLTVHVLSPSGLHHRDRSRAGERGTLEVLGDVLDQDLSGVASWIDIGHRPQSNCGHAGPQRQIVTSAGLVLSRSSPVRQNPSWVIVSETDAGTRQIRYTRAAVIVVVMTSWRLRRTPDAPRAIAKGAAEFIGDAVERASERGEI